MHCFHDLTFFPLLHLQKFICWLLASWTFKLQYSKISADWLEGFVLAHSFWDTCQHLMMWIFMTAVFPQVLMFFLCFPVIHRVGKPNVHWMINGGNPQSRGPVKSYAQRVMSYVLPVYHNLMRFSMNLIHSYTTRDTFIHGYAL